MTETERRDGLRVIFFGGFTLVNSALRNGRAARLMECAKASFATRGYYATSISQIVQRAGVARGTFYQYFDNKPHIFQSILDSFLEDLDECIRPISLRPEAPSPLDQIHHNLTRVLKLVLTERDLSQMLLTHASPPDRVVERRLNEFYSRIADMIERSLQLGMAMHLVRRCDTRLTAYSIIGAVKEVVLRLTSSQERRPPIEELAQELLQFGLGGILIGSQTRPWGRLNEPRGSSAPGHPLD